MRGGSYVSAIADQIFHTVVFFESILIVRHGEVRKAEWRAIDPCKCGYKVVS
jgi:hypothetical protein